MRREVISTGRTPAPKGPYSPAIRAGGFVFVSGTGPLDPGTGEPRLGPIEDQVRLTLENVRAVLEAAGATLRDVVKTTVYLADMDDFAAMNRVYANFFPADPPARTTIQAARLPLGIGVEIDAVAVAAQ
jgi:2-iminobutanoate/2-iminopropanoate deaminase